jgi:phosphoribosyl 1,2-cyclic phosphodiesterase
MLRNSGRGFQLISRISGRAGHLSNEQACEAVATFTTAELRTITLAHLSRDCNLPEIAAALMSATLKHIGRPEITLAIAKQDEPIPFTEL